MAEKSKSSKTSDMAIFKVIVKVKIIFKVFVKVMTKIVGLDPQDPHSYSSWCGSILITLLIFYFYMCILEGRGVIFVGMIFLSIY